MEYQSQANDILRSDSKSKPVKFEVFYLFKRAILSQAVRIS